VTFREKGVAMIHPLMLLFKLLWMLVKIVLFPTGILFGLPKVGLTDLNHVGVEARWK